MRSPVEFGQDFETEEERSFPIRSTFEWVLRGISLLTLIFLIWQAFHLLSERSSARAEGETVRETLVRWSTQETPQDVHVVLDSVPSPDLRDWLASFPATGTDMSWEGASLKPSAVAIEPIADPKGAARIWVAAPAGGTVIVSDSLGIIDSVQVEEGGAVINAHNVDGTIQASLDGTVATTTLRDSLKVKPVLILGIASWEGKFIMASLEEHGWKVDGRFQITPRGNGIVTQGPAEPRIDTANYAAVVVLDSSTTKYASALSNFVRNQGGGLIVTGYASPLAAFSALVPANASLPSILSDDIIEMDSGVPRSALKFAKLTQVKQNAIAIESNKDDEVMVAGWVLGNGRVLQVGYLDTWQWRLGGEEDDPVAPYRLWWSRMISSIAYAPRYDVPVEHEIEPTPMASLVSILGSPESKAELKASIMDDPRLLPFLFGLLMTCLFLEWASRRLRGRP